MQSQRCDPLSHASDPDPKENLGDWFLILIPDPIYHVTGSWSGINILG